jgi:hypothetical protein
MSRTGEISLPIHALSASVSRRLDHGRITIIAAVGTATEWGDVASVILGVIGGGTQNMQIGRASASLLPNAVEVVGFDPQPEPPARAGLR